MEDLVAYVYAYMHIYSSGMYIFFSYIYIYVYIYFTSPLYHSVMSEFKFCILGGNNCTRISESALDGDTNSHLWQTKAQQ